MRHSLQSRALAEFLGTAFLLIAVVGSGIMAERLAQGNVALALLANAVATGAALVALILAFGPISGAHFNPVVTLTDVLGAHLGWKGASAYLVAQVSGAFAGVAVAHAMFGLPVYTISQHARSGSNLILSEVVATLGLLLVIASCSRFQASAGAYAVGAYITGAYWFTSSTSFANPAVTLARCVTNTFAGIRPADAPGFLLAQLAAFAAAALLTRVLFAPRSEAAVPKTASLPEVKQA